MSVLMINEEIKADLNSLAEHAKNNEYTTDELLDIMNGAIEPPGYDKNFFRVIPVGFKVVYTIEHQPGGKMRHMSVSIGAAGALPNPVAVQEIMTILGFENKIEECMVHTAEEGSINILEKID